MQDKIKQFVEDMNQAWRSKNYAQLGNAYHPHVVFFNANRQVTVTGRSEMIDSYRQFAEMAKIHSFGISSMDVFSFQGTFIVHMNFEVEYEIPSGRFSEKGVEVYTIIPVENEFQIVWRTQIMGTEG